MCWGAAAGRTHLFPAAHGGLPPVSNRHRCTGAERVCFTVSKIERAVRGMKRKGRLKPHFGFQTASIIAASCPIPLHRLILPCIQPHQNQRRNHIADGDQKTVNQVRPRFGQRGRVRHSSGAWISSGCCLKTETICLKQSAVSGSLYLVLDFTIIPNSQI